MHVCTCITLNAIDQSSSWVVDVSPGSLCLRHFGQTKSLLRIFSFKIMRWGVFGCMLHRGSRSPVFCISLRPGDADFPCVFLKPLLVFRSFFIGRSVWVWPLRRASGSTMQTSGCGGWGRGSFVGMGRGSWLLGEEEWWLPPLPTAADILSTGRCSASSSESRFPSAVIEGHSSVSGGTSESDWDGSDSLKDVEEFPPLLA